MATPNIKMKATMNFSTMDLAVKSPKPMVDNVVIAKYQTLIKES